MTVASMAPATCFGQNEFNVDKWHIRMDGLQYVTQFLDFGQIKNANPDAIFIVVNMSVRNDADKGEAFFPQTILKLLVNGKEIDCADLESNLENIEPTLTVNRRGYFEVPKAFLNSQMVIRFQDGWLGKPYELAINQAKTSSVPTANLEEVLHSADPQIDKAFSTIAACLESFACW
jgi:hypothetical protein